jgi:O-antigen ligase
MPLELFVYIGAILSGGWSLARPQIGIYYLVLVFPLQTLRYGAMAYTMGAQLIDLVLLGVVIGMFLRRRTALFAEMPLKNLCMAFAVFWYWSLWYGSFLWSLPLPISIGDARFSDWKSIIEMTIFGFVTFAVIKNKAQIETVLIMMCVSMFYVAFDFFQVMSARDLSHYSYLLRYSGLMGYAGVNGLGAFAASMGLLLIGLYCWDLPVFLKLGIPVVSVACLYTVLFSFSRGAYLAFVAGALFIGIAKRSAGIILIFASILVVFAVVPGVSDRITGTYAQSGSSSEGSLDSSSQSRLLVWQDAIELIKSHPILGTGFDSYRYMHRVASLEDTHNYYLKVCLEEGPIGLLLYLALLGGMISQGYRLYRSGSNRFFSSLGLGFAACMVGAAVANVFGDRWTYQQIASYWWVLLAVVGRAQLLSDEANDKVDQVQAAAPELEPALV